MSAQSRLAALISAIGADIKSLTAQQTQLMSVAATTDELMISMSIGSFPSGGVPVLESKANAAMQLLVAPIRMRLLSCQLTRDYVSIPVNAADYVLVNLSQLRNAVKLGTIVSKTTAEEAWTLRVPWTFDGSVWDETYRTLEIGDTLQMGWSTVGPTYGVRAPMTVTLRYQPL